MLIQTRLKRFILLLHVGGYGDETVIIGKFSYSNSKFIPKIVTVDHFAQSALI